MEINVKRLLIDTASLHHSASAVNKRIDYALLIKTISVLHSEIFDTRIFVDANATGFIKYLESVGLDCEIITKEPIKKRVGKGERKWYLSFAVDIALHAMSNSIIVSTDIEIDSVLIHNQHNILYGLGIPKILRDHTKWYDLPSYCLTEKTNVIA